MSQYPQPVFHPPIKYPQAAPPQENGWGLAGFIVSTAGLLLCGIPSIIGVLLSTIGLRKEPRGLAIAGLVIGLIGVLEIASIGLFMFTVYRVAETGFGAVRENMVRTQLEFEAMAIGDAWEDKSRIPTQAEGDDLLAGKRDVIGNSIVYETDGVSFSLRSAGPDGVLDTEDDCVVGPYADANSTRQIGFGNDMNFDLDEFKDQLESMEGFEGFDEFEEQLESMEDALKDVEDALDDAEVN